MAFALLANVMMRRLWYSLTEPATCLIGLAASIAVCFLGAQLLKLALFWALLATLLLLLLAGGIWLWRRRRAGREASQLASAIGDVGAAPETAQQEQTGAEVRQLREALLEAIATIRSSRLGAVAGHRALRAAVVYGDRQSGCGEEYGDSQFRPAVSRCRQQGAARRRRHPPVRLVLYQRHSARYGGALFRAG
jgi:type VI protein secretion system component VasK